MSWRGIHVHSMSGYSAGKSILQKAPIFKVPFAHKKKNKKSDDEESLGQIEVHGISGEGVVLSPQTRLAVAQPQLRSIKTM